MSAAVAQQAASLPADEARSRMGMYRLLGRFYREEVDAALLDRLTEENALSALREAGLDLEIPAAANREAWLEQHAIEFTRLFIGPGRHVSPHESVHTPSGDHLLNNARTAMVRRFIHAAGFDFEESWRVYPDHIATELEFMEALIGVQAESLENGDEQEAGTSLMLQQEFMQRHLGEWIPAFCKRLCKEARLPLYSSLAKVTLQFLHLEKRYLQNS